MSYELTNDAALGAGDGMTDTLDDIDEPRAGDERAAARAKQADAKVTKASAVRRGLTIRVKLTLWYGGLFFLAGVLLIAINFFLVRNSLAIAPEKARAAVAEQLGINPAYLEPGGFGFDPGNPGGPLRAGSGQLDIPYRTADGGVVIVRVNVPQLVAQAQQELKNEALRQLWMRSLLALAIVTVITFGGAWFLAGRMLRPLHAITSTARRLSGSTLHERIDLKGPRDELKELADTFDGMLGRLDAAFTAQKDFVANASHELRTPLTIIRTEVDVALSDPDPTPAELQEMGSAVTDAVDRSERLIDGLLVLARADGTPNVTEVDLAELAAGELNRVSGEAEAMGLKLDLALQQAWTRGEPSLLARMIGNLVENAVRHNTPDGWFAVSTRMANGSAVLEVANGGPVVSPEDRDRLFERFYRPDRSRSRKTGGFGLGLPIVKSVVTAHEGTVDLAAPEEGGLRVTVTLPASQAAPAPAADQGSES